MNCERARRHRTTVLDCLRCAGVEEDIDHVLRQCQFSKEAWRSTKVNYWRVVIKSSWSNARALLTNPQRRLVEVKWKLPRDGWMCLNSDGSVHAGTRKAAAGGVIRDSRGEVLSAFSLNSGSCSITRAEIRGVMYGVEVAWKLGVHKLEIQVDSKCVVEILNGSDRSSDQYENLITKFQRLRARDWEIRLINIYRKANCFADALPARGYNLASGTAKQITTCEEISFWMPYDTAGTASWRAVVE
ncbi:Putative ribonuclease H protein At1g65750 [Linum grandiflorum]